jgi:hypothetical protein
MVEQDPDADPPQPKIPDPAIDPRGHSAPLPARVPRPAIHPRSHSAPLPARVPRPTIATVAAAIERPLPDATRSTTLRVEKTSRSRPGRPQHEVIAPAGWSFDAPGRPHGLIRSTRDQAIEAGEATELVRCPPGCWCGLSDEEDR